MLMGEIDRQAERAERLRQAREMAVNWGRWCRWHGELGSPLGRYPKTRHGGLERLYRAPPQWHPPEPRQPEPHDPSGYVFQIAYTKLPEVYRRVLTVEFCRRPWFLGGEREAGMVTAAILARITPRLYAITVDRALLAALNVLKKSA